MYLYLRHLRTTLRHVPRRLHEGGKHKNLHTLRYINRSFEMVHLFKTIFATEYRYVLAQAYAYSDSKVKFFFNSQPLEFEWQIYP